MGVFKLFQGTDYIKKLRLGLENIKLFLASKLLYQIPISGATVTCSTATYNGTTQTAQNISVVLSGETLTNNVDYAIQGNTSGINAGNYVFTANGINYFNSSANGTFTINKASGSVSTAPTAKGLTYNGNSQALVNAGSGTGTMMYKLGTGSWGTAIPSATTAGTYTVYYKASASTNYNESASGSVSCSIAKVTPTVTAPTAKSLTYNGSAQALVNAGSTDWGTLKYSLDNSTYSTSIPSGTNATSYTVYYKVDGDSNINNVAAKSVSVTIAKADASYTAPTAKSLTYNTSAQALLNAGSVTGGTMQYSSDNSTWSGTIPSGTNARTYTSYWRIVGDSNHNDKASASISTTISPKTVSSPTITLSQSTYTYANTAYTPTPTVKDGTVTIASSEYTVSYSNNTNVGTATCTITDKTGGNYTVSGSKTFTINCYSATAPTAKNGNWTGSAQDLVNAGSTSYGTMVYSTTSGGTYTTTIPTGVNAGSYEVWWKVTGNTNVCDTAATKVACAINKVAMSYTSPKATAYVYNGSARALMSGGTATGGSIQYSTTQSGTYSTTVPTQTTAGTYTTWWKAVPDNNHSGGTSAASASTTISKASGSVSTAPTAKSLTYNGNAQALVNAGSGTGTMLYSLDNSTYSTSIPSGTNATSYTVYYKASASTNYNESTTGSVACSIAKVTPTVTAPTAKSLTYNGSAQALVNAGSTNWGTLKYSLDNSTYSTSIPSGTNATSYTVYYKVDGDSNINNVAAKSVSVSIAKADTTYTAPTANNRTYDTTSKALLNAGSVTGGTIQYSSDNSTWSTTIPSGTNANTYTSYWRIVGDSNHNDKASASISTTISAKTVSSPTITLSQNSYVYSNTACQPTPTVKDGTVTISSSEYTVSYSNNTNVGTATCTITDKTGGNYTVSGSKTFIITKVTPTVTAPTPKTLTFNNANQVLANAGSTNWGTMQYCLNDSGGTYSTTVPSASAANTTYKVWYKVVGNSNINDVAPASIDCMIAEKRVTSPTIVLDPTSYTYNGSARQPSVTVKDGSVVIPAAEYTKSYSNNTNAGTATVTITDNTAGNYYISGTTTFTINKAAGSVSTVPTAKSLTYNGAAQQLVNAGSGTGTMMYKLDSGSWGTSVPTATNATSYTVYYKASASTNYNESASGSVSCSIAKVTPTVTAPSAKSLTYNGSAQALVNAGSTNFGSLQYSTTSGGTYSTSIPSGTNATSYEVWYKVIGDSNVNGTNPTKVSITINKANPTYTAPSKKTGLVYNGNNQNLLNAGSTSHGTIQYSSDNTNWSTTIPQGKNASTGYTAYWKLVGDSNHNNVNSTTISGITISKVTPTVTAPTAKSLTYNGSAQALYNAGSTNWGTIQYCATSGGTYSASMITATNAGSYECWYKVVGDSNINDVAAAKATGTSIAVLAGSISYGTTAVTKTYGNAAFTNALTKTGDGTVTYASNNTTVATVASNGQVTIKQAGSATITATVANTSNTTYATKTASYTLTVNKAAGSVTTAPTKKTLTWNGSAQALVNAGSGTGTMMYKLDSGSWGTAIPTATNATSYTVYYKASASTNYNESSSGSVSCSIAVKTGCTISFATTSVSKTYGNGAFTNAITNTGDGSLTWGSSNTTIATVASNGQVTIKQAGSCTISATTTSTTNCTYSTTAASYTLSVAKAAGSVSSAPTAKSLTYTGSAQALVNAGSGTGTMLYSLDNSTYSTAIPSGTNATTYTVYYKASASTNYNESTTGSVSVTIAKAAMTYTAPKVTTYTYGNTARALVSGASANGGSIQYSTAQTGTYSTTVPTQTNAGTYDTWWKAVPDSNHSGGTSAAKLTTTINCYTATAPTAKSLTYNTSAQALANAGSTSYGTMVYCSTSGGTFSTTMPTGTNAGSYEVWWKVTGNTNVCNTAATKVSCSIGAKTVSSPTITLSPASYIWNNTDRQPTPTVKDGTVTIASSEYTVSYSNNKAAGTGTCTITDNSGGNYTVSGSKTFTISKYTPTAPTAKSLNWTGSAQALVNAGSTSFGTIVYSTTSGGTYSTTIPTGTNAGSYEVWWKLSGDTTVTTNCNNTGATKIACTINKVAMTYNAPSATTYTYNGSARALMSGGTATGGSIQYSTAQSGTYSTTVPTQTTAGTYTTWWKAVPDSNHSGGTSAASASTTVSKAAGSVTINGVSLTYNGTARNLATVSNNTGTMHYSTNGTSWSTTIPTATNASGYTVYWYMDAATNYNAIASASTRYVSSTIAKADQAAPTATGATTTYNTTATATASGGGGQGSIEWSNGNTQTSVGSKTTKARWSGNTNYNASAWSNEVTLTMNKAAGSVSTAPVNNNYTYNGTARAVASAGSGTGTMYYRLGTSGSFSTTMPTMTNAGSSTLYYYAAESGNYYQSNTSSITVSVQKAVGSVSTAPTAKSLTYTGSAQALVNAGSGTGTMLYSLDNSTYGTAIPSGTNATTYTVYYKASAATNYNESTTGSVSVTIAKAAMTYTAPTATSYAYNGSARALVSGGSAAGGSIQYSTSQSGSYSTTVPTQTNAGTYTTWWKAVPDSNHSGGTNAASISTTISKINPTYTAPTTKGSLVYNGASQTLYNAGSNTTAGSFSYTNGTGTYIDTYTVSWTFTPTDTTNYNTKSGSFTAYIITNFKPSGSDGLITSDSKYFASKV